MKQEKRFTFDTIQMPTVCSAFLFIASGRLLRFTSYYGGAFSFKTTKP